MVKNYEESEGDTLKLRFLCKNHKAPPFDRNRIVVSVNNHSDVQLQHFIEARVLRVFSELTKLRVNAYSSKQSEYADLQLKVKQAVEGIKELLDKVEEARKRNDSLLSEYLLSVQALVKHINDQLNGLNVFSLARSVL